jgi:DeoR/GlpR family transcriptional regulator of sugar metabolism
MRGEKRTNQGMQGDRSQWLQEIQKLVNQKGELSVGDDCQLICIHKTTAYRQIQQFAQTSLINKISGASSRIEILPIQRCSKKWITDL